jgi:hypothetical protein
MHNKISLFLIIIASMLVLNSCSNIKKGLGLEKEIPNEFLIEKRGALTLPPDYQMLPPDSKSKIKEVKKSSASLKSVLDQNLNTKESQGKTENSATVDIEKEILKQIK